MTMQPPPRRPEIADVPAAPRRPSKRARRIIVRYTGVHGVPITARVVSVGEDRSTTINGRHPLHLAWEFRVNHEVYSGSLSTRQHLDLEEFLAAHEVVVLYDTDRPEINTLFIA